LTAIWRSGASERDLDDVHTGRLVADEVDLVERGLAGLHQRDATTGHDALLDGGLRVAHGVLDAVLALLQLDLGGRADLDHRNTAGQLGQALLQLLAVVVGVALVDLDPDLVDPALDLVGVTAAVHDRGLVLGDDDLAARPSMSRPVLSSLRPTSSLTTWRR
jgi:hypothetical protein